MLDARAMPAPSRIRDTPTAKENTLGFGVSASRRNADTNKLKRSITKPRPVRAKLLRCQAKRVRSAAHNTRGSGGLDMMKHPGLPIDRASTAMARRADSIRLEGANDAGSERRRRLRSLQPADQTSEVGTQIEPSRQE